MGQFSLAQMGQFLEALRLLAHNSFLWNLKREESDQRRQWLEETDRKSQWLDLQGANLSHADLHEVNLNAANLRGAYLGGANLHRAKLVGANLRKANLEAANLLYANLSGAYLNAANLHGANLGNADLHGANLHEANLSGANLNAANLNGADLGEANLNATDLRGADLTNANLEKVLVAWSDGSTITDFTNAIIENTQFTTETVDPHSGILELACMETLAKANFKNPKDLTDYISRAFEYALQEGIPEKEAIPDLVNVAFDRIKTLHQLYHGNEPSALVVEEIQQITTEVLAYLKSNPKKIYEIGTRQFEELIAEILAGFGWQVQLTPKSKDGGYDLFAVNKSAGGLETGWLIECKRYRNDRPVGIDIARSLYGVKARLNVAMAMLATTSYFTKGVRDLKASIYDLELRDYEGILEWINQYQPHPDGQWYHDKKSGLVLPK